MEEQDGQMRQVFKDNAVARFQSTESALLADVAREFGAGINTGDKWHAVPVHVQQWNTTARFEALLATSAAQNEQECSAWFRRHKVSIATH